MNQQERDKKYLGDGAYCEDNGYHMVLTTENGVSVTNTVFIEPEVWLALVRFVSSRWGTGFLSKVIAEQPKRGLEGEHAKEQP
jgi:hypothetical protein